MKKIILIAAFVCTTLSFSRAVEEKEVDYKVGSQTFKGFLAAPIGAKNKLPAIIIVHEWWGHNAYSRQRAKMLAEAGYVAFALDMYGDGKTANHPSQAGDMSGALRGDLKLSEQRFQAAMKELKSHPMVDADKIAAIGYCFGGYIVLEMARRGLDLKVVASFHGSLTAAQKAKKGKIKSKVLVFTGAEDPFVKKEEVDAFEAEMKAAEASYKLFSYPGATHSFTNKDADKLGEEFKLPLAYNQKADQGSWKELLSSFKENLGS